MIGKSRRRIYGTILAGVLAFFASAVIPGVQADTGVHHAQYYATINKGCGDAGPGCGNLSIFREQVGSGNEVSIALYHWKCLGFRGSPYRFRWLRSGVVETSDNRFFVRINRPKLKLKLRGWFIGEAGTTSRVKGSLTFRNLNRGCGFKGAHFSQRETGPTTDPQGSTTR